MVDNKDFQLIFMKKLYDEKLKHKDQRMTLVLHKMLFIIGFLGIGNIQIKSIELQYITILSPLISLAYDIYIHSENYKIRRIGKFVKENFMCSVEKEWEDFVTNKRENSPWIASFIITLIVLFLSAMTIVSNNNMSKTWIVIHILMCIGIIIVYSFLGKWEEKNK